MIANWLYNVSIIAAITGIILGACYLLILIVVKRELKNSMPNQIKEAQRLFGGKKVRIILTIDQNGKTTLDEWTHVDESLIGEYVG